MLAHAAPYKLTVKVIEAENLPVADITTSDPYVNIMLGEKLLARTKTVKRNHSHPVWQEEFVFPVLHRSLCLGFKIFDEDIGDDDDLMGEVTIELASLAFDKVLDRQYPVVNCGKFKAKASLHVSIFFQRQEDLVKIVHKETALTGSAFNAEDLQAILPEATIMTDMSDIVMSTLHEILHEDNEDRIKHINTDFITDLINDVYTLNPLTCPEIPIDLLQKSQMLARNKLRLVSSSKCDLDTGSFERCPFAPLDEHSIQINLSAREDVEGSEVKPVVRVDTLNMQADYILIKLPNRFSVWNWMKWLQVAHQYWTGFLGNNDIPEWATSNNLSVSSSMSLSFCENGVSTSFEDQRGSLQLEQAFEIRYGARKFSLKNMSELICSVDSISPLAYVIELSFPNTSDDSNVESGDEVKMADITPSFNQTNASDEMKKKDKSKKSGGIALCFCTSSQALDDSAHQPVSLKPPTGATRRRSSVSGLANNGNVLKKQHRLLAVRCRDETFLIDYSKQSLGKIFVDLDLKELDLLHKPSSMSIAEKRRSRPESFNLGRQQSSTSFQKLTLEMFLMSGIEGMEKILAQKKLFLNSMVTYSVTGHQNTKFGRNGAKYSTDVPMTTEIDLNQCFGLTLTVVSAKDLVLPASNSGKGRPKGLFIKVRLADAFGNSSERAQQTEQRSNNFPVSATPQFQNYLFTFLPDHYAAGKEQYALVELCIEDQNGVHICIGTVFVPLESFIGRDTQYTFPLSRFNCASTVYSQAIKKDIKLGEITLQLKKIEEDADSGKEHVLCQTLLHECNIFNSLWFAECLPTGSIDSEKVVTDRALVGVLYQGLRLSPIGIEAVVSSRNENIGNDFQINRSVSGIDSNGSGEVLIEVFENQRRQPFPPFNWSPPSITTAKFSDLNFNVSYIFADLDDASSPQGGEWIGDWMIDTSYTQTDEDGWSYGFTFAKVVDNYLKKSSLVNSNNTHARRRKWVRKLRALKTAEDTEEYKLTTEQLSYGFQSINTGKNGSSTKSPEYSKNKSNNSASAVETWRRQLSITYPTSILFTCKERLSGNADIILEWNQIKYWHVVTASILSITIQVERYFPDIANGSPYRTALVEIFISNCNARELKKWIEERKWFHRIRNSIRGLVSSGNMHGKQQASPATTKELETHTQNEHFSDNESSVGYVSDHDDSDHDGFQDIPETEDLSLGSETLAMLDDQLISLQQRLIMLEEESHNIAGTPMEEQFEVEKRIVYRQICRLKLYMAALVGVGLHGVHNFQEKEVRAIMESDFHKAQSIKLENEVATTNNRIEYLLDVAEKRIRDAALCGWNHRGGALEQVLKMFANGYFIEIVALLGAFFEDRGQTAVKGLTSKTELITTFMKHNNRLDMIIESALRPYGLKADPPANLTMFLDFNVLSQWYTSVLNMEMRMRVDDTFGVWKDLEKNVTGQADLYKYPIPWIPQQARGLFFSHIAEDLVEVLTTYLTFARLTKANVAPTFHDSLGKLDSKVCLTYINSFLYLSEGYQKALKEKEYLCIKDEDELTEYNTWLCSVANDAMRIAVNGIADPEVLFQRAQEAFADGKTEEQNKLLQRCHLAFEHLRLEALDQLSCTLYICIFHEKQTLLSDGILAAWKKYYSTASSESQPFFASIVGDVLYFLDSHKDFLEGASYNMLLQIMVDKLLVMFFSIIFDACHLGEHYDIYDSFFNHLMSDAEFIKTKFDAVLTQPFEEALQCTNTRACLEVLPHLMDVFSFEDLNSVEMDKSLTAIKQLTQHSKKFSIAMAKCLEYCFALRGVQHYFTKDQRNKLAPSPSTPVVPVKRGSLSSFNSSFSKSRDTPPISQTTSRDSATMGSSYSIPVGNAPARRSSFVQSFFSRTSVSEPTASREPLAGFDMLSSSSADSVFNKIDDDADLEKVRQAGIVACIDAVIQSIRTDSTPATVDKWSTTYSKFWIGRSSVERVFAEECTSARYTLGAQLVQTSVDVSKRAIHYEATENKSGSPSQTTLSVFSIFGRHTSRENLAIASSVKRNISLEDLSAEAELTIMITDLKIFNLFYLDMFRNPKPYLTFTVNGYTIKTKSKDAENHADWAADPPMQLKIFNAASSLLEIEVDLVYEGILSDNVVGTLKIPFNPHDPPTYRGKQFTITDYWKSTKASQASKRATLEGRSLPTLQLSMDCISNKIN